MKEWITAAALVAACSWAVYEADFSDSAKAADAKHHAEVEAAKVPRIVSRSADGCAVYAFNPGDRWRYFTRCGDQVTTDNTYTVRHTSGKTMTTEEVPDSITTEQTR